MLFDLSPLKAIAVAVALMAAVSAFAVYRQSLINDGWDRALRKVEQQNDKAREAASKVQRGVDECYESGRVWDTIVGTCND